MKRIFVFILSTITFLSFAQEKTTASLEFEVANMHNAYLNLKQDNVILKTFNLSQKGVAKDSLSIGTNPFYELTDDLTTRITVFLKPGYKLKITYDESKALETVNFSGEGSYNNNFLANFIRKEMSFNYSQLFTLDKVAFKTELDKHVMEHYKSFEGQMVDPMLENGIKGSIERSYNEAVTYYKQNNTVKSPAPPFEFMNYKGGTSKLSDFKGKYVYIDFWATWCGPCLGQIPHLKEVEAAYHNKNIVFIGISIDEFSNLEKWKKMVAAKGMTGVQLYAGQNSAFVSHFEVSSIPRFLLIDPEGIVIDEEAPRPSDPALRTKLDSLLK